jgi:hypothetical protein
MLVTPVRVRSARQGCKHTTLQVLRDGTPGFACSSTWSLLVKQKKQTAHMRALEQAAGEVVSGTGGQLLSQLAMETSGRMELEHDGRSWTGSLSAQDGL